MNKILTVLRASKLMDNSLGEYGYGGLNRTFQLETIWRKKNIETIHIDEISRAISTNRIQRILSALLLWLNGFRFAINKWMIGQCGQRSLIVLNALKSYKGVKILFLEDTYDFISFFLAKKMGYKTVAFPHNFETLMPGPVNDFFTNKPWPYNVMEELKHLRNCDAVFCISREEQWWLRANGIPAYYLPYFPIDEKMKGLLAIRKKRANQVVFEKVFLILAKKNHRHTRDGTIKLIQILNRLIDGRNDIRILIGGYESEFFETFISSKNIKILGTLNDIEMTKVMSQVKAMIVHQESGVGALTKIMDHLVAGIPVIANTLAARSFFDHNGVYLYDTSEQLLDFIMKDDFPPPLLPFPPDDFEKIMAEVIFNLAR